MLMPIYDLFTLTLQSSTPAGCRVEVNVHGDIVVFLLPYDTKTAMFVSQVNLAKDDYSKLSTFLICFTLRLTSIFLPFFLQF